jgi:hypothetical protein
MSFIAPIQIQHRFGREHARVYVALTVLGGTDVRPHPFVFDTGCAVTTVS